MSEQKSFYVRLYELVHDVVDSDKLLKLFNAQVNDGLKNENPKAVRILDEGAEIIGKFIFTAQHLGEYFEDKVKEAGKNPDDPNVDWWHLRDQLSEVWIEALHSVLAARTGLVKPATNILRRCYELAVYGTFYSSTFIKLTNGKDINPFVELSGYGLWVKNIGKRVGRKELDSIVDAIKNKTNMQSADARRELYSNFTRHYLQEICEGLCDEHRGKKPSDDGVLMTLDTSFNFLCSKCGKQTSVVFVEKTVPLETMLDIIKVKLNLVDDYGSEIKLLYDDLSALVHPNNPGHQHSPEFKIKDLEKWLDTLKRVLRLSLVFYSRGLSYIGYRDEETFSLLEERKYELDKITLRELYFAICQKIGAKFNEKNLGYNYEEDFKVPSYLKDTG